MAVNWIEIAQEMAEAARAGVAADRKRLREILAERDAEAGRTIPTEEVRSHVEKSTGRM